MNYYLIYPISNNSSFLYESSKHNFSSFTLQPSRYRPFIIVLYGTFYISSLYPSNSVLRTKLSIGYCLLLAYIYFKTVIKPLNFKNDTYGKKKAGIKYDFIKPLKFHVLKKSYLNLKSSIHEPKALFDK